MGKKKFHVADPKQLGFWLKVVVTCKTNGVDFTD